MGVYSTIFKIMLLTFKALHQQSPVYIQDLVAYYQPSRILRSSHLLLLNPTNFHLKIYGSRAFAVSAPELWNTLPVSIRSCDNLSSFKSKLKTHLFKKNLLFLAIFTFYYFLKCTFLIIKISTDHFAELYSA